MSFFSDLLEGFCGSDRDEDNEDEIDFCGMPSDQIVEIAIRRDFLLLQLQALVDAKTPEDAESALVAMEKEAGKDEKLMRFMVRAGTVDIIRGNIMLGTAGKGASFESSETSSAVANHLLKKMLPYYEERRLRELEKKRRGSWKMVVSGVG